MANCLTSTVALVEGVDYELDVLGGRIRFKSTGALGPTIPSFVAKGGCGVEVTFCATVPLRIPCPSKLNECLPCDDDPVLNISAEAPDSDRFLFNFNQRQRPDFGFSFEQLGCKRWCWSDVSQEDADLCAIRQVLECLNDGLLGPSGSLIPPFSPLQSPMLFSNTAQVCTTFCADGTSFGFVLPAGLVVDRNQAQANRIAHSLACRLSVLDRVCIVTNSLDDTCLNASYEKQLLAAGGTGFHANTLNIGQLSGLCSPEAVLLNDSFPYIWSATGLPLGLTVSPCSGVISGSAMQSGTFHVTLRAQDAVGSFQTKTLTLRVSPISITDSSILPDAQVGVSYSHTLTVNPLGTYFFQFFSGSPPDWLSLNSATGELTGTPDEVDDFIFEISIEASDGTVCKKEFTLAVTMTDYGNIVPDIMSPTIAYWHSGNPVPAGTYRVSYVTGAMEYAPCAPTQCWQVNAIGAGFHIKYNGGAADVLFPASSADFPTQPPVYAENAGKFIEFVHTGGTIGMMLVDAPYADNVAGTPNPTFKLVGP